jgi:lysophospholipase L1-like esterase
MKKLTIIVLSIFLALVIGEVLLRFKPVSDPYLSLKREKQLLLPNQFPVNLKLRFQAEEGLPGFRGTPANFTINNYGYRGDSLIVPKPNRELRIFVIGGSTAECLYIDDQETWSAVLQRELAQRFQTASVKVFNAGRSGTTTADHIAELVHRTVHLEPNVVILMCGLNDFLKSNFGYDYLHVDRRDPWESRGSVHWLKMLTTEFQLGRRAYYLYKRFEPYNMELAEHIPLKSQYNNLLERQKGIPLSHDVPNTNLSIYLQNLTTMIGVCQRHQIQLILMTQQTSWDSKNDSLIKQWHWLTVFKDKRYEENVLDSIMNEYNAVMKSLALQYTIPLFETDKVVAKTHEYFYDDCHFNPQGCALVGKKLSNFVWESLFSK